MKRLTLEEIGKLAGVSRATVSRVINHHPSISTEVRERVQQVINETGYQPNLAARSLASNQSKIIGLVIPNVIQEVFTDPYYPRLTQGISLACNQHGYTLSLFLFHSREEEREAVSRITGNGLLDGLIITADNIRDPLVPHLLQKKIPFVQIGHPDDASRVSYIDVDNVGGAYMAVCYLLNKGFRRIAQIATAHNMAGIDRDKGYRQAIQEHFGTVDESLIAYGDFSEQSGYDAMQKLLEQQPDAVFSQSDMMALGASLALRDAGLRIPQDIALMGFDDLPPALLCNPPLTTIHQPIQQTGVLAVETLIEMLQNPDTPVHHMLLPVELVERASV